MKKIIDKLNIIIYLVTMFIVIFCPKFNLISVSGTYVGIRIEDFLIAVFLFLYIIINIKNIKNIFENKKLKKVIKFFLIYILVCIFSSVIGIINGNVDAKISLIFLLRKIEYFSFLFMGYNAINVDKKATKRIFMILNISVIIHTIIVILHYFGFVGTYENGQYLYLTASRMRSTFNGSYEFSAYMILLLPIFMIQLISKDNAIKHKILNIIAIILLGICIYLTQSRTSLIIYLLMFLIIPIYELRSKIVNFIKTKTKTFILILLIFIVAGYFGLVKLFRTDRFRSLHLDSLIKDTQNAWKNRSFENYKEQYYVKVEPKKEETKKAEPKKEETKKEDNKKEKTKKEDNKKEKTKKEDNKKEETNKEEKKQKKQDIFAKYKESQKNKIQFDESYDQSYSWRISKWFGIIDKTLKSPIIGLGVSITREAVDGNYVRIFGETGIIGIISWVMFVASIFSVMKKSNSKFKFFVTYGMIILLLEAIFIDIFEASKIMMLYYFILGCSLYEEKSKEKKYEKNNSIVMASYNGEKYIKEQIESILVNMGNDDELIISDDGSIDKTIDIIKKYQKKDKRIILIKGPKNGIKQNFANAIEHANGKYIYLSDQDDVWDENKINIMSRYLKEYDVVTHNADIVDKNLKSMNLTCFKYRKSKKGKIKNIYKNRYIGCCMAFNARLIDKILPIPNNIEMHDQWIGLIGEKYGSSKFIDDCLIQYRRHDTNSSMMKHYPFDRMIKNRIKLIKNYLKR